MIALSQARRESLAAYAFATPASALIAATYLGPVAVLLWLSLTDYELGALAANFVGWENYRQLADDPEFWRSLRNTVVYVAVVLPGSVILGLAVALAVQRRKRLRSAYEIIYYLPVTSTLIAMATVWQFMLHPNLGPVNALTRLAGLGSFTFLTDPQLVLGTLAVIGIWQLVGFNMVLFLAGLAAIPRELYEAGDVDGCDSAIDRFLRITWPLLGPTTLFVVVTTAITAFKVFDTVAVLTQGGPLQASQVLLYSIYVEGFQYFRIGYAAALTVVFLAFILLFALAQALGLDRKVHYA